MNLVGGGSTARMPSTSCAVRTRTAVASDRGFVVPLVPRLVASGLPPWRDPRKMLAAYVEVIGGILDTHRPDAALLIAEDAHGPPTGFLLLVPATDCYRHERRGHLAQTVVVDQHDMAARLALMDAAYDWTRSRGCRLLTMGEFGADHPARAVYL